MLIHKNSRIYIYFGDVHSSISLEEIKQQQKMHAIEIIVQNMQVKQVVFPHQNHGVQGLLIDQYDDQDYIFNHVSDYIFTQKKSCGIGVVTADCLPIVIYDPVVHAVAIVHAGWKGLVAGIFEIALQNMKQTFGTISTGVEIYLGPAARPCCYEVQVDFVDKFLEYQDYYDVFFIQKENKTYFDSRAFVVVIARNLGINEENIYTRYNVCTICNISFCSYRREKEEARRQISMVCLY